MRLQLSKFPFVSCLRFSKRGRKLSSDFPLVGSFRWLRAEAPAIRKCKTQKCVSEYCNGTNLRLFIKFVRPKVACHLCNPPKQQRMRSQFEIKQKSTIIQLQNPALCHQMLLSPPKTDALRFCAKNRSTQTRHSADMARPWASDSRTLTFQSDAALCTVEYRRASVCTAVAFFRASAVRAPPLVHHFPIIALLDTLRSRSPLRTRPPHPTALP
jgi:hypothetical protein